MRYEPPAEKETVNSILNCLNEMSRKNVGGKVTGLNESSEVETWALEEERSLRLHQGQGQVSQAQ